MLVKYDGVYSIIYALVVLFGLCYANEFNSSFTPQHLAYLRNETQHLFKHAWNSYIQYGFPYDEVTPLTCQPYGPDYQDRDNTVRNDALGNASLTVIDNLDTLIIMEQWDDLTKMLDYLEANPDIFEQDTIVQVFEFSIRSLGGLLSAHLLLTDVMNKNINIPKKYDQFKQICNNYNGFLLNLAYKLGLKLIPSYKTKTNIPVPRINLKKGAKSVPSRLQRDGCTSGATTPVLEFTLLSYLTGDPQFKHYTQLSFWKLWASKLNFNLMPMTFDPISNQWKDTLTGVGASIDSFYEYAAKASIIFNDHYMWSVFKTSYKSLLIHLATGGGPNDGSMIFTNVGTNDGQVFGDWIDLLGAFWPGLQVLTGQLADAIKTHLVYLKIWDYFELIPERWRYTFHSNVSNASIHDIIALEWYPLRPEFIESTYYLYRATKDPMYLQIGERIVNLLKTKFMAPCGFSGIQDVRTGERQDRMETFVLGETLKYLYLLFDTNDENFLHGNLMKNKNWVFSTEAHPLWFHKKLDPRNKSRLNQDDLLHFKKPLFQQFLSLLDRGNEMNRKLSQNTGGFYQNITLPKVMDTDLEGVQYLDKYDPYESRFEKCELNPFKQQPGDFLSSGFYKWDQVFNPDYSFSKSLKRPEYLSQDLLDGSYVELTKSFYDKFTMFSKTPNRLYLQCPRIHTSSIYEVNVGDIQNMNKIEISKLKVNNETKPEEIFILDGDYWIPQFNSLRVNFEKIRLGDIDSGNNLIDLEYVDELRKDYTIVNQDNTTRRLNDTIIRIHKVNGIHIPQGLIVWTKPIKNRDINIANDGRIILDGCIIENLAVWYGES